MTFRDFVRSLLFRSTENARRRSRLPKPASRRLLVEQLEDRAVPAIIAGPDAFGYQASTYAFEAIDLVAGQPDVTVLLDLVDDQAYFISMGTNTFNFYGVTYNGSSLAASSNGMLTGPWPFAGTENSDLTYLTPAMIAPLWDDWVVTGTFDHGLLTKVESGRLIIEWSNVRGYPDVQQGGLSPSGVTFQAILELNTGTRPGDIIFNYVDLNSESLRTNGARATVGIKDFGIQGPNRLLVSYNSLSPYVGDGKAILVSFGINTTTTVTAANATYDGLAHGATAVVAPGSLAGTTTFLYTGTGATVYSSSAAPMNAGTYHVVATFTPADLSTYHASSGFANYTISKATLTGDATTQPVLNLAQGTFTITVSDVSGLASGDTLASFLSTAQYYITVNSTRYVFVPTTVTTSGSSITIGYTLRNSALVNQLAAQLTDITSGRTAVSAGFAMESMNYTFTDDYLTRLFYTVH